MAAPVSTGPTIVDRVGGDGCAIPTPGAAAATPGSAAISAAASATALVGEPFDELSILHEGRDELGLCRRKLGGKFGYCVCK